jgi:hypothetical protein
VVAVVVAVVVMVVVVMMAVRVVAVAAMAVTATATTTTPQRRQHPENYVATVAAAAFTVVWAGINLCTIGFTECPEGTGRSP